MNIKKNFIQINEEKQLDWFGHVVRRGHVRFLRLVFEWELEGWRKRGRSRKMCIFNVKMAMLNCG